MTLVFAASIISLTMRRVLYLALLLVLPAVVASCGTGDDGADTGTPTPTRRELSPPLEGGAQSPGPSERTNYRELADWRLPEPEELPPPPADADGPEFSPPPVPQCPEDWSQYARPAEGFRICHPDDWEINGDGYVTQLFQETWFSGGVFKFVDGVQGAHVSIYTINNYARPFTYTRDCRQAYAVTFAGQASVLCPDAPGALPEARIIAYHTRTDRFDYFVNVVPYFTYDAEDGGYEDYVDADLEELAIEIAHTFELTEPVPR